MFTPREQRKASVRKVDDSMLVDFLVASTMMLKDGSVFSSKDREEIRYNVQICKEEILRRMKGEN